MSWFTIVVGKSSEAERATIRDAHPAGSYEFACEDIFLLSGGIRETTVIDNEFSALSGSILCGLAVEVKHTSYTLINDPNHIAKIPSELSKGTYDGLFVGATWDPSSLSFFNDQLGLRDLYYHRQRHVAVISTNPYWASALLGKREIDFRNFGSRWLLFSQLGINSVIKEVTRLTPGQVVTISRQSNDISFHSNQWQPSQEREHVPSSFIHILSNILLFPQENDINTSLGLSGGLDSRLLLGLYLSNEKIDRKRVHAHTFGSPSHPDAIIASKLCKVFGIQHRVLDAPIPDTDTVIKELNEFAFHSFAGRRASSILQLRHYPQFDSTTTMLVDGAFGELYRRQFLNRLLVKGKNSILQKDHQRIAGHLRLFRSDFFDQEIHGMLEQGALNDIKALTDELPDPQSFGVENWLELFAIRSILPNVIGYEQTRTDQYVRSMMPFVFTSLLDTLFTMPLSSRNQGRSFRDVLKRSQKKLTKFSLVRSDTSYPYMLSAIPSYMWMRGKQKLGLNYRDTRSSDLLTQLKEFVLDLYLSQSVKEASCYDHAKLQPIVEGFYNGNKAYTSQLDWWLAFELWRRSLHTEAELAKVSVTSL